LSGKLQLTAILFTMDPAPSDMSGLSGYMSKVKSKSGICFRPHSARRSRFITIGRSVLAVVPKSHCSLSMSPLALKLPVPSLVVIGLVCVQHVALPDISTVLSLVFTGSSLILQNSHCGSAGCRSHGMLLLQLGSDARKRPPKVPN
jgi:hypothetical protein